MFRLIVGIGGVAAYLLALALFSCAFGAGVVILVQHWGVSKELAEIVGSAVGLAFGGGAAFLSAVWGFQKLEGL